MGCKRPSMLVSCPRVRARCVPAARASAGTCLPVVEHQHKVLLLDHVKGFGQLQLNKLDDLRVTGPRVGKEVKKGWLWASSRGGYGPAAGVVADQQRGWLWASSRAVCGSAAGLHPAARLQAQGQGP